MITKRVAMPLVKQLVTGMNNSLPRRHTSNPENTKPSTGLLVYLPERPRQTGYVQAV